MSNMIKENFVLFLKENCIHERYYSLEGKVKDDAFHLRKKGLCWEVYYFERGNEYDNILFEKEEEAIEYLFDIFNDAIIKYGNKAFPN